MKTIVVASLCRTVGFTPDVFVAENTSVAAGLVAVEVTAELNVYPDAYGGFGLVPSACIAEAFVRDDRAIFTRVI